MITPHPNAAEFVARMLAAYARAGSYADHGTASYSGLLRVDFQTSFVRGRRFRFEFHTGHSSTVIWSDGVHTYSHCPQAARIGLAEMIDDGAKIAQAIVEVGAVSHGASIVVPPMLLPVTIGTVFATRFAEFGDLHIDGYEPIGGRSCARVTGRAPGESLATLWIDRETYLLRRITTFRGSSLETTTYYEPSLDPLDINSIERPDVEKIPPLPRALLPCTGISIAAGSRRVAELVDGSSAARSGLAIGDEVEAVNGHRTSRDVDVFLALEGGNIGEQLALTIRRDATTFEILVRVEAAPSLATAAPSSPLIE